MEDYNKHIPKSWPKAEKPWEQYNWNGFGRNDVFEDERFKNMWWIEMNWTYEGMFSGEEPIVMFNKLGRYGNMGMHIHDVVEREKWDELAE